MSSVSQCDRCKTTLIAGEGSILTLHDRATQGVHDDEHAALPPLDLDICGLCRTDLGQWLGIEAPALTDDDEE